MLIVGMAHASYTYEYVMGLCELDPAHRNGSRVLDIKVENTSAPF